MLIRWIGLLTVIGIATRLNIEQVAQAQQPLKRVFVQQPCDPPVGIVRYGKRPSPRVSETLKVFYQRDQEVRKQQINEIDWEKLKREDRDRRVAVMAFLRDGQLFSADDYFYAAMIFQHGNCSEHFKLANTLAAKAMRGCMKSMNSYANRLTMSRIIAA